MLNHDPLMRLAHDRLRELRRAARAQSLSHAFYPDAERQPRLKRHWTNRT